MRRPAIVSALALLALSIVTSASASSPYRFTNRAATERQVSTQFVIAERRLGNPRAVVRSIACAKAGIGRVQCVVVASSPSSGTRTYAYAIKCTSDSGGVCATHVYPWPR